MNRLFYQGKKVRLGYPRPINYLLKKFRVNRKYKDRIFIKLFHDKKNLLELYNAINGSNYVNPEELQITTLKDAI